MENEQKPPDASKVIPFPSDRDSEEASQREQDKEELDNVKDSTPCAAAPVAPSSTQPTEYAGVTEIVTTDKTRQSVTNSVTKAKREAERVVFVEWLSLTDVQRQERNLPRTQRELAAALNLSEYTLSHWKADKGIQAALARRLKGRALERAPAILDHLAGKATGEKDKGCNEAARMVLDIALPPKAPDVTVEVNIGDVLRSDLEKQVELPEWARAAVIEGEAIEIETPEK